MLENRRHIRFREIMDVRWGILGSDVAGAGKVYNISLSGLLLQTDAQYTPQRQGLVFIDAQDDEALAFGAKKCRVIWTRRMPEGRPGYQCGVEFVTPSFDRPLQQWIDRKTEEMAQAGNANILSHYFS